MVGEDKAVLGAKSRRFWHMSQRVDWIIASNALAHHFFGMVDILSCFEWIEENSKRQAY